ncbi:SDR family oxidoreductase [Sphingomonas sp. HT-1]|uniref:SDR family oxidoreductase n=1 Tax=unclassified Sphingomonas TaxID=196159 RepID=UPI0002EDA933|nr:MULTISPECIES: SDR family oxidoreductase [unclassified Sphingomonas]KTF68262.1 NAD(P)-dependent oxidoreductase [Sphingomonas sp. WG]
MILVTGATGKLGRQILAELRSRMDPTKLAISVRDPGRAADLEASGILVRRGDYADPVSLTDAFEGAHQILLLSSNARASGGDAVAQHRNAIEAARAVGVRRIVYTSHMGACETSAFSPMHDHAATEALLVESGIAWTALRNGFYAATVTMLMGGAADSGVLEAPEDGPVAWTDHADLAAAAAAVLCNEGSFDGPTPPLTGEQALDLAGIATLLSGQAGRTIERRMVSDEEQEAWLCARGVPAGAVAMMLGLYHAARNGEFSRTDPLLSQLIGRRPIPLAEVLARNGADNAIVTSPSSSTPR